MFRNYFKIFFRNMKKHAGYSICNISGLAVGMVTCILVLLFVKYEFGWNSFHKNYENIYRVQQKVFFKESIDIYGQTGYPLAGELKRKFPEIKEAVTTQNIWGEYLASNDEESFFEQRGFYTGSNLFNLFSFDLVEGNPETALSEPFSVILTKDLAEKYFPGQNPMGKTIRASKNGYLKVTGIISHIPANSDLKPDYLVSLSTLKEVSAWKEFDELRNIDAGTCWTFVLLNPGISAESFNKKIYNFNDEYIPDNYKKLYLKPLSELHLTSNEKDDIKVALYYLGGIAVFVLILACINFINLATANSNLRNKEIGLRKVVGATKFSLFRQFIGESIAYSLISLLLAFVLAEVLLSWFNTVVQRQMVLNYLDDAGFFLSIVAAFLFTGVLSGVYPALFLSSFQPADVIKGNVSIGKKKRDNSRSFLRKSLVTFQFAISISLIISTIYVMKQVSFMKNKDLGFIKENLMLCRVFGSEAEGSFETLRNELLGNDDIVDAAASINAPFNGYWGKEINWEGAAAGEKLGIGFNSVGYDFINTYKMEIIYGRNFSREFSTDSMACIINETAMKELGWKDPLGKKIDDNRYTIIGVVKDFHYYSVHVKIPPVYITLNRDDIQSYNLYSIRIKPGSRESAAAFIDQKFRMFFPDAIIEVQSFDEELQYGTEDVWETVEKVFFFFAIIAVLIAANGLFGLISFAAQRRTKEIGIRKVFGAKVPGLYLMISKEFLYLFLISLLISVPAGYFVALTTPGAYKYQMQVSDYLIAAGLMFITAVAATTYHTTKTVLSNPVESLKYE